MSRNVKLLRQAIDFIHDGKRQDARPLLLAVLREDKTNELAWKWYIKSFTRPEEKRAAFQKWQLNDPSNRLARQGVQRFETIYFPTPRALPKEPTWFSQRVQLWSLATLFIVTIMGTTLLLPADQSFASPQIAASPQMSAPSQTAIIEQTTPINTISDEAETLAVMVSQIQILEQQVVAIELENVRLLQQATDASSNELAIDGQNDALTELLIEAQGVATGQAEKMILLEGRILELQEIIAQNNQVPGIVIQGDNVRFNLRRANGLTWSFEVPYEELVSSNSLTIKNQQYNKLTQVTTADGMIGQVMEYRPFIQYEVFKPMMTELMMHNSDEHALMVDAWTFVSQLELDNSKIMRSPQYPLETLMEKGGDVEDKAILLASMLYAAPVDWEVSLYFMDLESPTKRHSPNHLLVKVTYLARTYYLDPSSTTMIPHEYVDGWEFRIN